MENGLNKKQPEQNAKNDTNLALSVNISDRWHSMPLLVLKPSLTIRKLNNDCDKFSEQNDDNVEPDHQKFE